MMNIMYKGESIHGKEFYNLLSKSEKFTSELGKVTLASGMLEAEILMCFKRKGIVIKSNATLGTLIKVGQENNVFDSNLLIALNETKRQRNDFIHKLYSLFIDLIDDVKLPTTNLIDTDVLTYCDYAWQLRDNLEGLAEIISRK